MTRKALASTLLTVGLLAGACGDEDRPTVTSWVPRWEATRDLVPDASTIEDKGAEVCGTFLGEVRERRDELTPAPTKTAEEAFIAWVDEAETLGLDCVNSTEDLDQRLADLDELARRVDATLGGR